MNALARFLGALTIGAAMTVGCASKEAEPVAAPPPEPMAAPLAPAPPVEDDDASMAAPSGSEDPSGRGTTTTGGGVAPTEPARGGRGTADGGG